LETITTIPELRRALQKQRRFGKTIGFVPTMGFFHEGHLALMREARKLSDVVVVSIFVNPIQFGPNEDYRAYPRDLKRDSQLAEKIGVDYLFTPSVAEMYPEGFATKVSVQKITEGLCGRGRPGHFDGVATVVTKLFNIVQPDMAFFGEKDYQQLVMVKKLVKELNFNIEIKAIPIVREADGLALSSRNTYLNSEERRAALVLYQSLKLAERMLTDGEKNLTKMKEKIKNLIAEKSLVKLEYIEFCDPETLVPLSEVKDKVLVAIAAKVGQARLIDNLIFKKKGWGETKRCTD
jgi:pantoate--beta-alanine ligase